MFGDSADSASEECSKTVYNNRGERNYGMRRDGTETWTFVIEENRVAVIKVVATHLINESPRVCEEELHVQQMCV